jgi:hypothetical protein
MVFAACSSDDGGGGGDDDDTQDVFPTTGAYVHFASDTINVPSTPAESTQFGLNIDGDSQGHVDNALGGLLAALSMNGLDAQASLNESIAAGKLVLLHSIRSDDATLMADDSVGWRVYIGDKHETPAPPVFDGTDTFTVDATSQQDSFVVGSLTAGQFNGGPGTVSIQISLAGSDPLRLDLIGARIKATVTPTGVTTGVLGGAVTNDDIQNNILPAVVPLVNSAILTNDGVDGALVMCPANPCPPTNVKGEAVTCDTDRGLCLSASSKNVLNLLDADKDGTVTLAEIQSNSIVSSLLAPDVDMDKNGTKESLSVGIGFTTVAAMFTAAGE